MLIEYIDIKNPMAELVTMEVKQGIFSICIDYLGYLQQDQKETFIQKSELVQIVCNIISEYDSPKSSISKKYFLLTFKMLEPMLVSDYYSYLDQQEDLLTDFQHTKIDILKNQLQQLYDNDTLNVLENILANKMKGDDTTSDEINAFLQYFGDHIHLKISQKNEFNI